MSVAETRFVSIRKTSMPDSRSKQKTMVTLGKNMFCKKNILRLIFKTVVSKISKRPRLTDLSKQNFAFFNVRRKIKIALFPLTCRRRVESVGGKIFFIFCVFLSYLKMGKEVETC